MGWPLQAVAVLLLDAAKVSNPQMRTFNGRNLKVGKSWTAVLRRT
ncbi:hypothetical protein Bphyt_6676 [Paraburkholderia phytofirmans PsJN]|uniref:Uncharacterized protein n=1 Tax=Paraburkholderia phytofirmans (strain DSM 17436 / LMG 22146 / PsJN) TaxID=398527 RepID=B2T972_PARPJ|nr:hypothetical protein Bphyt_6676 [Paraburkholderia phytofirmans PsJN]